MPACKDPEREAARQAKRSVAMMGDANPMRRPEVAAKQGAAQRGEKHGRWKGGVKAYNSAHARVRVARGKASEHVCIDCGGTARDWSLRHGVEVQIQAGGEKDGCAYSLDVNDYDPRCDPCHRTYNKEVS